jgi:hypothetical protein
MQAIEASETIFHVPTSTDQSSILDSSKALVAMVESDELSTSKAAN